MEDSFVPDLGRREGRVPIGGEHHFKWMATCGAYRAQPEMP